MFQDSGSAGFPIEALQHFRIAAEVLGQSLDRNLATKISVECAIDLPHSSAAEDVDDVVFSDPRNVWRTHGSLLA
jgi:hypothetical protein